MLVYFSLVRFFYTSKRNEQTRLEYELIILLKIILEWKIKIYSKDYTISQRNSDLWYIKIPSRTHGVSTFQFKKNSFIFVASDSLLGSSKILSSEPLWGRGGHQPKKIVRYTLRHFNFLNELFLLQIFLLQQVYCSQAEAEIF